MTNYPVAEGFGGVDQNLDEIHVGNDFICLSKQARMQSSACGTFDRYATPVFHRDFLPIQTHTQDNAVRRKDPSFGTCRLLLSVHAFSLNGWIDVPLAAHSGLCMPSRPSAPGTHHTFELSAGWVAKLNTGKLVYLIMESILEIRVVTA